MGHGSMNSSGKTVGFDSRNVSMSILLDRNFTEVNLFWWQSRLVSMDCNTDKNFYLKKVVGTFHQNIAVSYFAAVTARWPFGSTYDNIVFHQTVEKLLTVLSTEVHILFVEWKNRYCCILESPSFAWRCIVCGFQVLSGRPEIEELSSGWGRGIRLPNLHQYLVMDEKTSLIKMA